MENKEKAVEKDTASVALGKKSVQSANIIEEEVDLNPMVLEGYEPIDRHFLVEVPKSAYKTRSGIIMPAASDKDEELIVNNGHTVIKCDPNCQFVKPGDTVRMRGDLSFNKLEFKDESGTGEPKAYYLLSEYSIALVRRRKRPVSGVATKDGLEIKTE